VRAVLALVGTALGLALLFSFRTPAVTPLAAGGRGDASIPSPTRPATAAGGGIAAGGTGAGGARPTASPAVATPAVRASSDRTTSASTAAPTELALSTAPAATTGRGPAPTTVPATPRPTAQPASGDVTGPIEQTPFGDVQVEVKVVGGQLVDVVALQLPNDRRRSAQISQYVEPILREEALQAQSASIDLISGATWTSGAYQASLQAALAQIAG
jgi:uncharacterized protein with FMN-binding domain